MVWHDIVRRKKEEYREPKQYWITRLFFNGLLFESPKEFDIIRFKNGYQKDARQMDVKFIKIDFEEGVLKWGAEKNKQYIRIHLGEIITTKNCNNLKP